jgi:hypothetical protein
MKCSERDCYMAEGHHGPHRPYDEVFSRPADPELAKLVDSIREGEARLLAALRARRTA